MPILNYSTEIAVTKTMGEIQGSLARRGVQRISTLFDDEGTPAGLAFTMRTDYGVRDFELPIRTAGVLAAMRHDAKIPKSKQTPEQAARVAWRIASDLHQILARVSQPASDPRETEHIECDCVPHLGPTHCHLCSTRTGREMPWSEAHPQPASEVERQVQYDDGEWSRTIEVEQ